MMVPRPEVVGDLGRHAAGGGARRDARLAVHPLPGLPRLARRDHRHPARARPLLGAARPRDRRGRDRRAAAARLHRPRDEGSGRAARRVPQARTSTWRSSSTSTARRRGSSRSRTCSRRSSARSRTSSTCRTSRSSGSTRHTIRIDGTFPIDDFNEQFGTDARARGLPHDGGLRLRPARARAPRPGDEVRSDGLRFRVIETEGSRIQRLEVEFKEPIEEPEPVEE